MLLLRPCSLLNQVLGPLLPMQIYPKCAMSEFWISCTDARRSLGVFLLVFLRRRSHLYGCHRGLIFVTGTGAGASITHQGTSYTQLEWSVSAFLWYFLFPLSLPLNFYIGGCCPRCRHIQKAPWVHFEVAAPISSQHCIVRFAFLIFFLFTLLFYFCSSSLETIYYCIYLSVLCVELSLCATLKDNFIPM
jgi:hypothetical protein